VPADDVAKVLLVRTGGVGLDLAGLLEVLKLTLSVLLCLLRGIWVVDGGLCIIV
jgi:hypothetical protein